MAVAVANFLLLNTGISSAVTAAAVAGAAVSTATSIAISSVVSAINKPKFDPAQLAAGIKGNSRVSDGAKQFFYGERMTGGNIIFESTQGTMNKFYHIVIPIAGHEVDSVGDVYFDDKIANIDDHGADENPVYEITISGSYLADGTVSIDIDTNQATTANVTSGSTAISIAAELQANWINPSANIIASGDVLTITGVNEGVDIDVVYNDSSTGFTGTIIKTVEERRPLYRITKYTGAPGQAADPDLIAEVPEWTSEMRGDNQAYVYVRLEYIRDVWKVFPIIRAVVRGKKVLDVRTGITEYSNNPDLIIRDYLISDYGGRVPEEDINDQSFINAANICDEQVQISDTLSENRYACNAVGPMDAQWTDIITYMSESAAGQTIQVNGYYEFHPGYAKQASITITEDDLREGSVDVDNGGGPENIWNGVKGTFISPDDLYAATDYPQLDNQVYVDSDNGFVRYMPQDYPYTTSHTTAQRLSKMALLRARESKTVRLKLKMIGRYIKHGSVVNINIPRAKLNNEKYIVTDWFPHQKGADVTFRIEKDSSYEWDHTEAKPFNSEFLPYLGSAFSFSDEVNNVVEIP